MLHKLLKAFHYVVKQAINMLGISDLAEDEMSEKN